LVVDGSPENRAVAFPSKEDILACIEYAAELTEDQIILDKVVA
jgi:uncharacterized protein (DUF433 family)